MRSPKKAMMNPLTSERPAILDMIEIPNSAKPKVSGALKLSANCASFGATIIRITTLIIPPIAEEIVETVNALYACPC